MTTLATQQPQTSPPLRLSSRGTGLAGLALIAVMVGLNGVVARVPAGTAHVGPPLSPPSAAFQFGTDLLGRDMASETLHALAVTVDAASIAMLVAVFAGGLAGFCAARLPWGLGWVLRRAMGVLAAVPALFLAVLFIGASDRSFATICAGLAATPLVFTRTFDRAHSLSRSAHAEFARATGVPPSTLLRRDLVYEFRASFLAIAARSLAAVAILLSTASFFGFGGAPPNRDLGLMIAAARDTYLDAWWTAAFPAAALALLVLFARLAAGLEDGERP